MDYVIVEELEVEGSVGILDWERTQTQRLLVSAELPISAKEVAQSDDIEKTINYAQVRESIHYFAKNNRVDLLETWADQLAEHLFEALPGATQLSLRVVKPDIFADAKAVGVSIERSRKEM